MQRLATLAVLAVLISPTMASGQDYTFGDWARDQGYEPGDVMPEVVGIGSPLSLICDHMRDVGGAAFLATVSAPTSGFASPLS